MNSRLFIVSGPSGAGKSSLCQALLKRCPQLQLSISCTTRSPRLAEADGEDYHFLTAEAFEQAVQQDDFLEWACVHDHRYGTRRSDVMDALSAGHDVLLEIDWQGAAMVANKLPDAVRVFILPPNIDTLRQRLEAREQDTEAVIQRRIEAAESEMSHADEAHHQIVNDYFDDSLQQLFALLQPA
ncbi:MAG: guanylate kinase [Mariprofundaceae bacterium]|nr:guanylate kinase [Mariprofundaceae bacterium]